MKNLQKRSLY